MSVILDASAVLAILWNEPGIEQVRVRLNGAMISAVNVTEVYAKSVEKTQDIDIIRQVLFEMPIVVRDFDERAAFLAGQLRQTTRALGLSLGDRACLATAMLEKRPVLTADRAWLKLDLGIEVIPIR